MSTDFLGDLDRLDHACEQLAEAFFAEVGILALRSREDSARWSGAARGVQT
jgi:hypothetical protein